jgi:hypothetical protein
MLVIRPEEFRVRSKGFAKGDSAKAIRDVVAMLSGKKEKEGKAATPQPSPSPRPAQSPAYRHFGGRKNEKRATRMRGAFYVCVLTSQWGGRGRPGSVSGGWAGAVRGGACGWQARSSQPGPRGSRLHRSSQPHALTLYTFFEIL